MGRLFCLVLLLGVFAPGTSPAVAQDRGVKRDPFDTRLVGRYKSILARKPTDRDALNKLAGMYRKHRSIKLLVSQYEKQASKKPSFSAYFVLARLAETNQNRERAIEMYEKAQSLRAENADVAMELGRLYRRAARPADARAAYEKALSSAGSKKKLKKRALKALIDLSLDAADHEGAIRHSEAYLRIAPKETQVRIDLADGLVRLKKYDLAIGSYQNAEKGLKSDPSLRAEVIARLGSAEEAAGKDEAALKTYRRAMAMTRKGHHLRKELTARVIEIYRRKQALATLLAEYEKKWKPGARGHFEWDMLARLYEEVGNQDKAIRAYRQATAKSPYELDTHRRLITLLENAGRDRDAIKQYEKVVRVAPGDARFQLELAKRYWKTGSDKKALALLARVSNRFAGDPGVYAALADLYTRWGKDALALKAFSRLTSIEPNEVSHLVNLGEQYFQRNDKRRAVAIWKRIINKRTAANYARLAHVYAEHDMLPDALAAYARAIKMSPKQEKFLRGRAVVYERQKEYKAAVKDWETVLALIADDDKRRPQVREARQRVVHLLKRSGGSVLTRRVAAWRKDFAKTPPDLGAGYFLVEAHLRMAQLKRARGVLERLLTLQPDDIDAMHQLVKVYRAERSYDKAVEVLTTLVGKSPGREREYYTQIAELKTILHKDAEAIDFARKALEKSPNDPVAHQRLAERYEHMQQYKSAIAAYEKTIENDPRKFKAYFALARLYRNQDQHTKAARLYQQVLKRSSDSALLSKAGREAINLQELMGDLGELEQVIAPLSFTLSHKKVYRRILVELYGRYVPALVADMRSGAPEKQASAEKELTRLGAHGLKPLLEALNDEKDPLQQRLAVRVLGFLGNQGAAAPLVKLAQKSHGGPPQSGKPTTLSPFLPAIDWDVRVEALIAAGRLEDPRTIQDLVQLSTHREASMREAAIFALGMTGDGRAVAPLLRALEDSLVGAQVLACVGLGRLGGAQVAKRLGAVVADGNRADATRASCAYALGVLRGGAQLSLLETVLGEGNDEVQRTAAWAIGRIGKKSSVPALFRAFFARRAHVREAVAWALERAASNAGPGESIQEIPSYPMLHGRFDTKTAVASLLGRLSAKPLSTQVIVGHEQIVAESIRAALARHRDVVVRVLEELDGARGRLRLGALSTAKESRQTELNALTRVGNAIVPELELLRSHRDPIVRRMSLSVIAKVGAPKASELLKLGMKDPAKSVRAAAMLSAAHRVADTGKDTDLTGVITGYLADERWQDRVAAAVALGHVGNSGVAPVLARALASDRNSFVREAAAISIGQLRATGVSGALLKSTAHKSEPIADVRIAALRSLNRVAPERAQKVIPKILSSDPSPHVRRAARGLTAKKQ